MGRDVAITQSGACHLVFFDSLAGFSLFWQESPKDVVMLGLFVGMGKVIAWSGADQGLFSGLLRDLSALMQVFGTDGDGGEVVALPSGECIIRCRGPHET